MKPMAIIYKITNKLNRKIYIGKSVHTLATRWSQHCSAAKSKKLEGCRYLNRAIRKYGRENFSIQTFLTVPEEELDFYETKYIDLFQSTNPLVGYNLKSGGQGGRPNKETLERMSIAQIGNKNCVGRVLSQETRDKISAAHKGKKLTADRAKALHDAKRNAIVSLETRQRMSFAHQRVRT